MTNRFNNVVTILILTASASILTMAKPSQAMPPAQTNDIRRPEKAYLEPLNDLFRDAFFHNTGDVFFQTSIESQVIRFFGLQYMDLQIAADAELVHYFHVEAMRQQNSAAPPLRGRDLNNPFDSSLWENPCYSRTPSQGSCSK